MLEKPVPQIYTQPGKPVDPDEDFSEWGIDSLQEHVQLVQEFDRLCDQIVDEFVHYAESEIMPNEIC